MRHNSGGILRPSVYCLGWDVNNKQGYAEAYKDVIHEDTVTILSGTGSCLPLWTITYAMAHISTFTYLPVAEIPGE